MASDLFQLRDKYLQGTRGKSISKNRDFFLQELANSSLLQQQEGNRPFLSAFQEYYRKAVKWEKDQREPKNRPEFPPLKAAIQLIDHFLDIMKHPSAHDAPEIMHDFVRDISKAYANLVLEEIASGVLTANIKEFGIAGHITFLQDYQPELWYEIYSMIQCNPDLKLSDFFRRMYEIKCQHAGGRCSKGDPREALDWESYQRAWLDQQIGKNSEAFFEKYPELAARDYSEFQQSRSETEILTQQFLSIRFVEALSAVLDQVNAITPVEQVVGKTKKAQLQSIYQVLARCTNYQENALIPLVDVIGPIPPGDNRDAYLKKLNYLLDWYHSVFEGLLKKHVPFILYYPNLQVFHKTAQIQDILRGISTVYGCPQCGTPIDQDTKICPECQAPQERCVICRRPISFGETIGRCLHCETNFHEQHLLEWLKSNETCPNCRKNLSETKIQSFTVGLASKFKSLKKLGS